jgi:hypothetical protein
LRPREWWWWFTVFVAGSTPPPQEKLLVVIAVVVIEKAKNNICVSSLFELWCTCFITKTEVSFFLVCTDCEEKGRQKREIFLFF